MNKQYLSLFSLKHMPLYTVFLKCENAVHCVSKKPFYAVYPEHRSEGLFASGLVLMGIKSLFFPPKKKGKYPMQQWIPKGLLQAWLKIPYPPTHATPKGEGKKIRGMKWWKRTTRTFQQKWRFWLIFLSGNCPEWGHKSHPNQVYGKQVHKKFFMLNIMFVKRDISFLGNDICSVGGVYGFELSD